MRFPVFLEHLPTFWNHALRSISYFSRPAGIGADQMCAAHETGRHPPAGKTVQLRGSSPHKNMIIRARLFDDPLNNRKKMERLRSYRKSYHEESYWRDGGRTNHACSDPSPT